MEISFGSLWGVLSWGPLSTIPELPCYADASRKALSPAFM